MFRYFRRNQKFFIVVGGVILMFVFLVGDYLPQIMGDSETPDRESPNATLASWEGGKLTHAEYQAELQKRKILNQFIRNVVGMGEQKAVARGIEDPMLPVVPIGLLPDTRDTNQIRAQVVSDRMLADMARDRGISVSRDTLEAYIAKLGFGELSSGELTSLLAISGPVKVSGDYVLGALEEQFMAKMMLGFYGVESDAFLLAEMPYDRWESWRYVNDLVSVEAAALNVDDFRIDVPDPTDAQLKELYEEFKEVVPHPVPVEGVTLPSPNPAFAIPRKIKLQYLHLNYEDSIQRLMTQVTDEEVKEFYEKNKGLYSKAESLDLFDIPGDEPGDQPEGTPEGEPEGSVPKTPAKTEGTEGEAAPAGENPPASDAPAGETPAGDTPPADTGETPPADEPTATEEPADAPDETTPPVEGAENPGDERAETPPAAGAEENPTPEPETTTSLSRGNLQFVSFQTEGAEGDSQDPSVTEDQPATTEEPTAEPAESQPPQSEGEANAEPSGQEPPAANKPPASETPAGQDAPATDEPADTLPGTGEPSTGETSAEAPDAEVEYEPLEDVADDVRKRIAEQRYAEEIETKLATIMGRLRTTAREYRRELYAAEAEGKPVPKAPEELADLSKLAEEFGLTYEQTVELDMFEMLETDVGSSYEVDDFLPVRNLMFSDRISLYQPIEAHSFGGGKFGDRYVVMKTSDTPGRTPPFDEVKSAVRDAWIRREAAKVALKRAEEYAAKAKEAGQSLKDFFDGNERVKVVETNAFSRYTQGEAASAGSPPTYKLSQPPEITNPGLEFMEEAFDLGSEDVGAALNFDKSIAYVVRVANPIETEESLQGSFLASANSWDGRMAFQRATAQGRAQQIYENLRKQFNIEFTEDEISEETEAE